MRIKLLALSFFVFGLMPLFAQQGLKFGHVDTEEVFNAMPELQAVQKQLEEEYSKQESNLTTMQEELKSLQDKYVSEVKTLTPEQKNTRENELMEMNQRIQNFYTLAQQQLQAKEQELKAPLIQKIQNAIQAVGEENGFLYIFESNAGFTVFHSEKSVDVAPLVKVKLGIN